MESVHVPSVGRRYWSGIFSSSGDIYFLHSTVYIKFYEACRVIGRFYQGRLQ